jgi:cysteine desulfurase family protein (TIGR01976 family)
MGLSIGAPSLAAPDRAADGARAARTLRCVPTYDVAAVRARFPSLSRPGPDGRPLAWLDGPAGTQVPLDCLEAMDAYLRRSNANTHGAFPASEETDVLVDAVRGSVADLLGAGDPGEVSFGPNMTTIAFALSRAIGRLLGPGDEVVVTRLDHDANVAPWLAMAEERDLVVRWVGVRPDDATLDLEGLERVLGSRTRLVAVGLASNAVGTVNPVTRIAALARAVGAWLWVDAVHAAPHLPIEVASLGADLLVCSAYKVYGPHLGVLWGRREVLEALPAYRVRPAGDALPGRLETGTQAHELLAGLAGTLRHLEWVGVSQGGAPGVPGDGDGERRARLRAAMAAARAHERALGLRLVERLLAVPGLRIVGITDPGRADERCPTVGFTLRGHHPRAVADALGRRGIHAWDGDFYAFELVRALGLAERGGLVRVGLVGYSTAEEVERLGDALEAIARG